MAHCAGKLNAGARDGLLCYEIHSAYKMNSAKLRLSGGNLLIVFIKLK